MTADRYALVTGCNSMLGLAVARRLLDDGFNIAAHYHTNHERVDELSARHPGRVLPVQAELDERGVASILECTKALNLRVLVNNAATIVAETPADKLNWEIFGKTFAVNAIAPAMLALACFERMKTGGGKIINISSIAARYGGGETTLHYGMSKAALDALTPNLARRGAQHGILVNSIRPGVMDTDFHARNTPGKDMKKRMAMVPLKRLGSPDEVAAMVGHLVSKNGDFITGEIITIAGGD